MKQSSASSRSQVASFQDQFWGQYYLVSFNCVDDGLECDLNKYIWMILSCLICWWTEPPFSGAWRNGLIGGALWGSMKRNVESCTSDEVALYSSTGSYTRTWLEDRFPGRDLGLRWITSSMGSGSGKGQPHSGLC